MKIEICNRHVVCASPEEVARWYSDVGYMQSKRLQVWSLHWDLGGERGGRPPRFLVELKVWKAGLE